jgi:hypothetical protein
MVIRMNRMIIDCNSAMCVIVVSKQQITFYKYEIPTTIELN